MSDIIKKIWSELWQRDNGPVQRIIYAKLNNGKTIALDRTKVLGKVGGKNITNSKLQSLTGGHANPLASKDFTL